MPIAIDHDNLIFEAEKYLEKSTDAIEGGVQVPEEVLVQVLISIAYSLIALAEATAADS